MKTGVSTLLIIFTALLTACGDEPPASRQDPVNLVDGDTYNPTEQPVFKELGQWDGICEDEILIEYLETNSFKELGWLDPYQDGCQISATCFTDGQCDYANSPETKYCTLYPIYYEADIDNEFPRWIKICEPGEEGYVPEQFREAHMPGGWAHYIDGKLGINR